MVTQPPLDRWTQRVLRDVVLEHRETEPRRRFPPTLRVGLPGRAHAHTLEPEAPYDAGLRTDLAVALLQRARRDTAVPLAWLTRPGDLTVQDQDLAWSSAVRQAASSLGVRVSLVVVTRQGWRDPGSGTHREWRRLRRQPSRSRPVPRDSPAT